MMASSHFAPQRCHAESTAKANPNMLMLPAGYRTFGQHVDPQDKAHNHKGPAGLSDVPGWDSSALSP